MIKKGSLVKTLFTIAEFSVVLFLPYFLEVLISAVERNYEIVIPIHFNLDVIYIIYAIAFPAGLTYLVIRQSGKSNDINIINKIIEFESKRLEQLQIALNKYSKIVDPFAINAKVIKYCNSIIDEKNINHNDFRMELIKLEEDLDCEFLNLTRLLLLDNNLEPNEQESFKTIIRLAYKNAKELIVFYLDTISEYEQIEFISEGKTKFYQKVFKDFKLNKEIYFQEQEIKLKRLLYENLSLDEIREMYNSEVKDNG